MAVATSLPVPIDCALCGRPFIVTVPLRTEPVDGWLSVVVDRDYLTAAVRVHALQHAN